MPVALSSSDRGTMKTKLAIALAIAIAAMLLLAPACRRQNTGGKRVIAVIPKGTSHFFWQSVHAGAESAAKELGVEIMWKGPEHENDNAAQTNIVEDAINRRVDGIALAPTHKDALVPIVERAQRENIPVAIFDSGIGTENYVSYIATDNHQGGVVAAERLAAKLGGKGKIAILGSRPVQSRPISAKPDSRKRSSRNIRASKSSRFNMARPTARVRSIAPRTF